MICVLALIVFSILAIFSVSYRPLAAEAFDCVFRRVTFRKCRSGLDKRLKARLTGRASRVSKRLGRFVYRYFEVFSWLFLILLVLSLVQTGISAYNLAVYGNCNGLDEEGFCVFDPTGQKEEQVSTCNVEGSVPEGEEALAPPEKSSLLDNPSLGPSDADVTVVEFGCFSCPNTAEQASAVKRFLENRPDNVRFVFIDFPLEHHDHAYKASLAAECVNRVAPRKYWDYHFLLFDRQEDFTDASFREWALDLGVDGQAFDACMASEEASAVVESDITLGRDLGIYGTPTFFINDEPLVGVKAYRFLKAKVKRAD
ncbi:DsbA family protein [Candidatus Woesearchaeota archaeon]|nr:DsbA family protein [Candidatus Woesearchaeota archaeon]